MTGQVILVTWSVIGWAYSELSLGKRQKRQSNLSVRRCDIIYAYYHINLDGAVGMECIRCHRPVDYVMIFDWYIGRPAILPTVITFFLLSKEPAVATVTPLTWEYQFQTIHPKK